MSITWKKGCFGNTSYLYIVLIPYSEHRFFAVDDQSLEYLRQTGRADETIKKVEAYLKANMLFRTYAPRYVYSNSKLERNSY